MAHLMYDCPHCGNPKVRFELVADKPWAEGRFYLEEKEGYFNALAQCDDCRGPLAITVIWDNTGFSSYRPKDYHGNILDHSAGLWVFPSHKSIIAPEHVPKIVADSFEKAAKNRRSKDLSEAAILYRKTLELALKKFDPDSRDLDPSLNERIDNLAKANKIIPALKEWAHHIREIGNEAAHDEESQTEEEVDELHEFTEMLLICLFTLPKRIELAKEIKEEKKKEREKSKIPTA